ncbi:hypothetical protein KP509_18G029400 [Ceratopteris richardii]|nr:hypothetical protein KP509_18G029400 [Ceratopteris richardii]
MVLTWIKVPVFFLNIITDMYAKCGSLQDAFAVFNAIENRNLISWNVMVANQVKCGAPKDAITVFRQMNMEGVAPDHVTFLGLLDACSCMSDLASGIQAHIQLVSSGLKPQSMTTNALINMYTKCYSMDLAHKVFEKMDEHTVISWNTLLSGYSMHRDWSRVIKCFEEMTHSPVEADYVSYLIAVNACASIGALELGLNVHTKLKQAGVKHDVVLENALLDMYTKCGGIDIALQIFNQMQVRNVISWTVMIMSNYYYRSLDMAFFLFDQMHCEGIIANDATILGILGACCNFGNFKRGQQIHAVLVNNEYEDFVHVGNAVIDMYSKLGSLENAHRCFDSMRKRDGITWNTIVSSYAKCGYAKEVLELLQQMREEGIKLDSTALAVVLSACSRAGLVAEAFTCLTTIQDDDQVTPNADYYACIVDLLARAGLLEMADELHECNLNQISLSSWRALLSACKVHGDSERAKAMANTLLHTQPSNAEVLDVISNMHYFLREDSIMR